MMFNGPFSGREIIGMPDLRRLALGVLLSLLACAPAMASVPTELVRALYGEANISLSPAQSTAYFAHDLDVALRADSANPGEVGAVDFDYRYGAQDDQISGLNFIEEIDHDSASVVAVFKNFGKANSVNWTLCRRNDGSWRVADAWSNTGSETWDLRDMLKLARDRVRC